MRALFTIALPFVLISGAGCKSRKSDQKITASRTAPVDSVGGKATVAIARMKNGKPEQVCSGTLVARQLVVTSASCLQEMAGEDIKIIFGPAIASEQASHMPVAEIKFFSPTPAKYYPNLDLAWIKLSQDAPAGSEPAEILRSQKRIKDLQIEEVEAFGFGQFREGCREEDSTCRGEKKYARMELFQSLEQPHFHGLRFAGAKLSSLCPGDRGGPVMARIDGKDLVAAMNSGDGGMFGIKWSASPFFPDDPCRPGPGILTNLSPYVAWIEETSGIKLLASDQNTSESSDPLDPMEASPTTWEDWEKYDNYNRPAWYTTQKILISAASQYNSANQTKVSTLDFVSNPKLSTPFITEKLLMLNLDGLQADFRSLKMKNVQIHDIEPLKSLPHLRALSLRNNHITRFTPLKSLTSLEFLTIGQNYDFETQALAPVPLELVPDNLRTLDIQGPLTSVSGTLPDAAVLKNMTRLTINNVQNFELAMIPDGLLRQLKQLTLTQLKIKDVSRLALAQNLETLILDKNEIEDLSALISLDGKLTTLKISDNRITNLSVLSKMTSLIHVEALRNPAQDGVCPPSAQTCALPWKQNANFLEACLTTERWHENTKNQWPEWQSLQALASYLARVNPRLGTSIPSREFCQNFESTLTSLTRLDIKSQNQHGSPKINSLELLTWFPQLSSLSFQDQELIDPTPLTRLPQLESLDLSGNPIDKLEFIQYMPALKVLTVSNVSSFKGLASNTLEQLTVKRYSGASFTLDLQDFGSLPKLSFLSLDSIKLLSITRLKDIENLQKLEMNSIDTENGPLRSLAGFPLLPKLKEITIAFDIMIDSTCPVIEGGICRFGKREIGPTPPIAKPEDAAGPETIPTASPAQPIPTAPAAPAEPGQNTEGLELPLIVGEEFIFPGSGKVYRHQ